MPAMNLLDIPLEIRARIFRPLLTRPCPVVVLLENSRAHRFHIQDACSATECCFLKSQDQYTRGCDQIRLICVGPLFSIKLLRVCKQIYHEAIEILYTANKFILASSTPEDIPLSNVDLYRIRSLQLNVPDLVGYQLIIKSLRLNPNVHLTVYIESNLKELPHDFATNLLSLVPAKSYSLSIGGSFTKYSKATDLGIKLSRRASRSFVKYNDLPKEIRYQILSYTDLVQNYHIHGDMIFGLDCCYRCSDTISPCCCNTVAGSRFSDRCECKVNPLALLKVSSGFRAEALEVMFGRQSQFHFHGTMKHNLSFLRKIELHLPYMRVMTLRISHVDMERWRERDDRWTYGGSTNDSPDSYWEELIERLISFSTLPRLSLTLIMSWLQYNPWEPDSIEKDWGEHQDYYRTFIPSFQRLIANGLVDLKFEFLGSLDFWLDEYKALVFGGEGSTNRIAADDHRLADFRDS